MIDCLSRLFSHIVNRRTGKAYLTLVFCNNMQAQESENAIKTGKNNKKHDETG